MSAEIASSAAWPEVVWDAPMLRGLDARARSEIEAAGKMLELRAGDVLYRHGDPADVIYVVASGVCAIDGVRRGDLDSAVIRRARKGDVLGEEAIALSFSTRQLEARCEEDALVAEVSLVVLKRAVGRAGGADLMAKIERALRRAATLDLLRTTSFTSGLTDSDMDLFLDAARHVHIARGDHVYREGEAAGDAFVVADGLLQVQTDDEGRPRIEAYLGRGDLFGDEELEGREPRGVSVVASGPTWLVAIPCDVFVVVARRNRDRLDAARRLLRPRGPAEKPGLQTTAHVFRDLYRMRIARSLLVIDQDSCIRCGHCAWTCADVHEDGVSRLVRHGDTMIVSGASSDGTEAVTTTPLLVPNSCQHCKNPACMIDCPTGAIGRDSRGEVFIREELCTGCGSCAKACPWENIQMAPRNDRSAYPAVAVKCDLCKGVDGGPACVASCPTQAIARIDPNEALVEIRIPDKAVRAQAHRVFPRRVQSWPWVLGSGLVGVGMAGLSVRPWVSGLLAGALVVSLVGYAVGKRVRGSRRKLRSTSRGLFIAHLSLGAFACGAIHMHVGGHVPPNVAGALTVSLTLAILTGALGAIIAALLPRALSRVERKSVLPEELAARAKEIDERIFATLSGKSELTKTLFVHALRPYRRSTVGPLMLLLSRRTSSQEENVLRARLDILTGGRVTGPKHRAGRDPALAGVDDLLRLVVEHRALRVQRVLTWALRGWLVPHVAATAAAVILLVLHVVAVSWPAPSTLPASTRAPVVRTR